MIDIAAAREIDFGPSLLTREICRGGECRLWPILCSHLMTGETKIHIRRPHLKAPTMAALAFKIAMLKDLLAAAVLVYSHKHWRALVSYSKVLLVAS